MKANSLLILITFLLFGTYTASAQSSSVILKNGSGIVQNTYPSLQAAYNAIPATLTQAYIIEIDSFYNGISETYPIILGVKAGADATNTITIRPRNNYPVYVLGSSKNSPVIVLDGASWLRFDGHKSPFLSPLLQLGSMPEDIAIGRSSYPAVLLRNGAAHNLFNYCRFNNGDHGALIPDEAAFYIGGTNNAKGNDSNSVLNCTFASSDNMFVANGDTAHPNTGLVIDSCTFVRCYYQNLAIRGGTRGIRLTNNKFTIGFGGLTKYQSSGGILVASISDTCRIEKNVFDFGFLNDSGDVAVKLSNDLVGAGYYHIANNAITLCNTYYAAGQSGAFSTSSALPRGDDYMGISLTGDGPLHAGLFYNTVRFSRNHDSASATPIRSTCFNYSGTNSGNQLAIQNNLFINTRVVGGSSINHLAIDLANVNGIVADYNTYSNGQRCVVNGQLYASFGDYQYAVRFQELHSNDSTVLFDGIAGTDLSAAMYTKQSIQGMTIASVTDDRYGTPRNYPYRGSFEIAPNCNTASAGSIQSPTLQVCSGASPLLNYTPATGVNGMAHQWQRRLASASVFTDIPGEIATSLLVPQAEDTWYRVKDSCIGGASAATYSNEIMVSTLHAGVIGTISEIHTDNIYTFTLSGASNSNNYWNMGDGNSFAWPDTVLNYTYTQPGTYVVLIKSMGGCDTQTISLTVTVLAAGIGNVSGDDKEVMMYPNPAHSTINLKLTNGGTIKQAFLIDQTGRVITQQSFTGRDAIIDVHTVPAGYYMLRVVSDKKAVYMPVNVIH